jgi:hypothetical protein
MAMTEGGRNRVARKPERRTGNQAAGGELIG